MSYYHANLERAQQLQAQYEDLVRQMNALSAGGEARSHALSPDSSGAQSANSQSVQSSASSESLRLYELTRLGASARPRFMDYTVEQKQQQSHLTPRQEVEERKRASQAVDMKTRPSSNSRSLSGRTTPLKDSSFEQVGSRYMNVFHSHASRTETPRETVEREVESKKVLDMSLRSPSPSPKQRVQQDINERRRKANNTPSRYMDGVFAPPTDGRVTPRRAVEERKRTEEAAMVCLRPPSGASLSQGLLAESDELSLQDVSLLHAIHAPRDLHRLLFQATAVLLGVAPVLKPDPSSQQGVKMHDWVSPVQALMVQPFRFLERLSSWAGGASVSSDAFKRLRRVVREPDFTAGCFEKIGPKQACVKLYAWIMRCSVLVAEAHGADPQCLQVKFATRRPSSPPRRPAVMSPVSSVPETPPSSSSISPSFTIAFGRTMSSSSGLVSPSHAAMSIAPSASAGTETSSPVPSSSPKSQHSQAAPLITAHSSPQQQESDPQIVQDARAAVHTAATTRKGAIDALRTAVEAQKECALELSVDRMQALLLYERLDPVVVAAGVIPATVGLGMGAVCNELLLDPGAPAAEEAETEGDAQLLLLLGKDAAEITQRLQNCNLSTIPDSVLESVERSLKKAFDPESEQASSAALESIRSSQYAAYVLCRWLRSTAFLVRCARQVETARAAHVAARQRLQEVSTMQSRPIDPNTSVTATTAAAPSLFQ